MVDIRTLKTQEKILRAASQVTLDDGIGQLTLEAVASKAGISKGGLLYHFNTKEALIEGMIDYHLSRFETRLEEKLAQHHHWLKAYIEASLQGDPVEDQMSVSLLAAVVLNPELLNPLRERYQRWQEKFTAHSQGTIAPTAIRLILDGLWISNLLNLAPLSARQIEALHRYLLAMSGE
jgi:AcrR family transcriptional regulator